MNNRKRITILIVQGLILITVMIISLFIGPFEISYNDMTDILAYRLGWLNDPGDLYRAAYVVEEVRMPRVLMAALAGMNLAVSGAVMQNVLKNPLADPYVLGLSSSAAFGAALYIVLGQSVVMSKNIAVSDSFMIAGNAFFFSMLSLILVVVIVRKKAQSTVIMLLSGIAIGGLFSAGLGLLKYMSDNESLRNMETWLMGGFWGASYTNIMVLASISAVCYVVLYRFSWKLNAIFAGDEVATTLGVNVRFINGVSIVLATLMVAATISFSGIIGFVGLVCPFISRSIIGIDNRFLLPSAFFTGGILLSLADLAGRNIISPAEVPVGIVTAFLGTPFFLYLLVRKNSQMW